MKATSLPSILFTDFYQLTMAQLYFRHGLHELPAQFDHFFRSYPNYGEHQAGYCITAGLEWLIDWMQGIQYHEHEIDYLRSQRGSSGKRLFEDDFLDWLCNSGVFSGITLHAIPEGRVVHPNVPLTIIQGPLAQAQLLETTLLNFLNFQTLVATKAARIYHAGRGQPVLEFGIRRAQGQAANAGARAAMIGGASFTSNVEASRLLGYTPKGTHAHSLIQVFMALGEGEIEAFRAYAELYPDDCTLLIDTINTLESGLPHAIKVFEELRQRGHEPSGVRLDSGDLAYLSIQVSKILDAAGFPNVRIVLSNELDEIHLWQILSQIEEEANIYGVEADHVIKRLVYGVGTRLITSAGDSALDGVYKLVAVHKNANWIPAIKISENPEKVLTPGQKAVWRLYDKRGKATADLITLDDEQPATTDPVYLHHPSRVAVYREMPQETLSTIEPLHVPILEECKPVYDFPPLDALRDQCRRDIEALDAGVRRIVRPHIYHVSLSAQLWELKRTLMQSTEIKS